MSVATCAARFAHRSEEDFANLFDFFRIDWQYKPKSFPITWDTEGNVVESFTPDFYLPEFNLYVEVTTAASRFRTRKNRKLRLLRAAYPDVRVKLFHRDAVEYVLGKFAA
ncbi:MAG: hypothetical protein NVSMB31_09330 [Vulcanimicrobiaceae bacterium]